MSNHKCVTPTNTETAPVLTIGTLWAAQLVQFAAADQAALAAAAWPSRVRGTSMGRNAIILQYQRVRCPHNILKGGGVPVFRWLQALILSDAAVLLFLDCCSVAIFASLRRFRACSIRRPNAVAQPHDGPGSIAPRRPWIYSPTTALVYSPTTALDLFCQPDLLCPRGFD